MGRRFRRLTSLFGTREADRERQEQDLKDELDFHFKTEVERRVAAGLSTADALASAKRDFGNVPLDEVLDIRCFNLNAILELDPEFLAEAPHDHHDEVESLVFRYDKP